jgi:hypothetical protein
MVSRGMRKISIRNIKLVIVSLMIATCILKVGYANAAIYKGKPHNRISIEISDMGVNRIEVKKDRIAKVIGSMEEYNIEGDRKTGVIYLSAKAIAGEVLAITIITEKGYTQDVNLKVTKAKEPKTIVIEKPRAKEAKVEVKEKQDIKEQVIEIIKDISSGNDRNYTRREIGLKEIGNYEKEKKYQEDLGKNAVYVGYRALKEKQVKVTKVTEYSNRDFKIIRYEYSSKPSELGINAISSLFKNGLSISERGNAIIVVYKL